MLNSNSTWSCTHCGAIWKGKQQWEPYTPPYVSQEPLWPIMPYKKSSRAWGNKEKKGHLVNVLAYAVHNMEKLKEEKDRRRLRAIARSLYLTAAGVRVNYEGHELVTMFKELTAGCVLLTLGQSAASARKYRAYAANAKPLAGITDVEESQSLEDEASASLEVRTSASPESAPAPKGLGRRLPRLPRPNSPSPSPEAHFLHPRPKWASRPAPKAGCIPRELLLHLGGHGGGGWRRGQHSGPLGQQSCVLAVMKSCHEDASQYLDPELFVIIVRFLGEPDQDLPESTIRHVFSQLFSISWCSRLLADFYQYWYDWECDISFHH